MIFMPEWDYDVDSFTRKKGCVSVDLKGHLSSRLCVGWVTDAPHAVIFAEVADGVAAFESMMEFALWWASKRGEG
jgi:hypothetical protein